MNWAVLLSGGTGSRIHTEIPKQYVRICGRMLFFYALEPLLASALIDKVVIVAEEKWHGPIRQEIKEAGLNGEKVSGFSLPGANRQGSILNALQGIVVSRHGFESEHPYPIEYASSRNHPSGDIREHISGEEDRDTVLIHDAARPFLAEETIEACYASLEGHDGVMPVLPMKDTVYYSRDGRHVEKLLQRSSIYAGQAPELFRLKKYYLANLALLPERILQVNGSTEPAVLAGMDIAMIPGDEGNFKVTTESDLQRARERMNRNSGKK